MEGHTLKKVRVSQIGHYECKKRKNKGKGGRQGEDTSSRLRCQAGGGTKELGKGVDIVKIHRTELSKN